MQQVHGAERRIGERRAHSTIKGREPFSKRGKKQRRRESKQQIRFLQESTTPESSQKDRVKTHTGDSTRKLSLKAIEEEKGEGFSIASFFFYKLGAQTLKFQRSVSGSALVRKQDKAPRSGQCGLRILQVAHEEANRLLDRILYHHLVKVIWSLGRQKTWQAPSSCQVYPYGDKDTCWGQQTLVLAVCCNLP